MATPLQRIAYLGPVGTFTEQAVHSQADLVANELVAYPSMSDVLFAVDDGTVDLGVVPIENALEGTVNVTIDHLAFDVDLLIQREIVLPVRMNLMARPGTRLDDIKTVLTIPVAWAQCRTWLRANLPGVEFVATGSTAEAAQAVAEYDGLLAQHGGKMSMALDFSSTRFGDDDLAPPRAIVDAVQTLLQLPPTHFWKCNPDEKPRSPPSLSRPPAVALFSLWLPCPNGASVGRSSPCLPGKGCSHTNPMRQRGF